MIRAATKGDVNRLVELAALLHSTSNYARGGFSPEKVRSFLGQQIDGDGVVFVAEVGADVVGGLVGGLTDEWFSDELVAFDYSLFVDPKRRSGLLAIKLLRAFEHWARARGAVRIQMGIGTGVQVAGTSRLYESLGFEFFGPMFTKELC